jgi:hypothetical protein
MAVVMTRKRGSSLTPILPPSQKHLRAIKTFGQRVSAGMDVMGDESKTKQAAVTKVAKKIARSERYVWGTVKLGSKMYDAALAFFEKEASRNKQRKPRTVAALFLLHELRDRPRLMKEIEILARKSDIAITTLRRACKDLSVRKRRTGGRDGHWTWELPQDIKKSFGIEV